MLPWNHCDQHLYSMRLQGWLGWVGQHGWQQYQHGRSSGTQNASLYLFLVRPTYLLTYSTQWDHHKIYEHGQTARELQPSTLHFLCACTRQSDSYGSWSTDVVLSLWCPANSQLYQKSVHRIGNDSNKWTHARWKEAAKIKTCNHTTFCKE